MALQKHLVRTVWKWAAPIAGLAALALAFYFYFHAPRERKHYLRISAGSAKAVRHKLAQQLQSELAGQSLMLELHPTVGSEEALDQVNDHKLDLALVQGGLKVNSWKNVRQVTALHIEPMHLLVKNELFESVSKQLAALDGKTIYLSEVGSGTHTLAIEILSFVGIGPRTADRPTGYIPVEWSREKLLAEKDRSKLPDAVMLVSSLPSDNSKHLITKHDYRLIALPFGEAFALESLSAREIDQTGRHKEHLIDKGRTYAVSIPAYTYSVEPPVPPSPVPTLGSRLLLVAHKDVDPQAVRTLLEATFASQITKLSRPPIDAKILEGQPEYPWHDGTRLYIERNAPILSGAVMDSAQKGFAILAAAASGLFVLWQWSKQHGQFLRDKGFNKYIHQITRIEEQALSIERTQLANVSRLVELREELDRLKTEALDRFTEGELAGKDLLSGFLVQVNDARDLLRRLISQQETQREYPSDKERSSKSNEVPAGQ
jgi:TRAP-type uncharacterized transport system substrate-binding protein